MTNIDSLVTIEATEDGIKFSVDEKTRDDNQRFVNIVYRRIARYFGTERCDKLYLSSLIEKEKKIWYTSEAMIDSMIGYCFLNPETLRSQSVFNNRFMLIMNIDGRWDKKLEEDTKRFWGEVRRGEEN